jgi:hypothetical protein
VFRGGLLSFLYFVAGAFVAGDEGYLTDANTIKEIASGLLGLFLWPLVALGVDLKI